jgi:hypothetical protein
VVSSCIPPGDRATISNPTRASAAAPMSRGGPAGSR